MSLSGTGHLRALAADVSCSRCLFVSLFPGALVSWDCWNKLSQIGWVKTTEIYPLIVWRPEFQNRGVSRAMLPPRVLGGIFPTSSSSRGLQTPLSAILCHHEHMTFFSESVSKFLSPHKNLSNWIGGHLHPTYPHFNSMSSEKTLFLNKATFMGTGD